MDIQKIALGLLLLLNLLIPLFREELFPYSSFPMFSNVHEGYEQLEIVGSDEKKYNKQVVQQKYLGVPQDLSYGIRPAQSMSKFGDEIKDHYLQDVLLVGDRAIIRKFGQKEDGDYGLISEREITVK